MSGNGSAPNGAGGASAETGASAKTEGGGRISPLLPNFTTSTVRMGKFQKAFLVLAPALLAASTPLYDWDREALSFVLFGVALGAWGAALAAWLGTRGR